MRKTIEGVDFAVDEHIWGHRLYDEQLPHLTVLEFLSVLGSNLDKPLQAGPTDRVKYRPQRQIRLRALLFNNPFVESVSEKSIADDQKWSEWNKLFGADIDSLEFGDTAYLKDVFQSFDDFAKAIELLRSSAFEAKSNKRWTSKFVFPFGPDSLYEDLRITPEGDVSNDRRFFARTGELLYLMLSRAHNGPQLGKLLADRLFNSEAPLNLLVKALQGEIQLAIADRDVGYLPHASHHRFDKICDDWLAILSRDMPVYDALEHLILSAGLNLSLYFLECAKSQLGDADSVEFICEVISRERTKMRGLSASSYRTNQAYSLRAVRASIESIEESSDWLIALRSADANNETATLCRSWFQWPKGDGSDEGISSLTTGKELLQKLIEMAEARHERHIGKIHATWSRAIGLSSRRLSRSTRYAPTDRLLKTLVITIVEDRMQFDEFLSEIRRRYGLVIGDQEGARLVNEKLIDQEALTDNRNNLESRLVGLGLVKRLSDSCSFVQNPFVIDGAN
jgi:hypothetical protein